MGTIYVFSIALHVVGAFFNIRLLVSCLKFDERSNLQLSGRAGMILQAILQLTLLGLNADDSMNLFSKQQQLGWCNMNGVLIISVGFVFFYNMVAIIAIEYPSVFCLKQELSPRTAMFGTLTASISTIGVLFWSGFFRLENMCESRVPSAIVCSLLFLITIPIVWRICRAKEPTTSSSKKVDEPSYRLLDLLSADKTSTIVSTSFLALVFLTLSLQAIGYTFNFQEEQFESFFYGEKLLYLFTMCFGLGIALPIISMKVIEFSVCEENIDGYILQRV